MIKHLSNFKRLKIIQAEKISLSQEEEFPILVQFIESLLTMPCLEIIDLICYGNKEVSTFEMVLSIIRILNEKVASMVSKSLRVFKFELDAHPPYRVHGKS